MKSIRPGKEVERNDRYVLLTKARRRAGLRRSRGVAVEGAPARPVWGIAAGNDPPPRSRGMSVSSAAATVAIDVPASQLDHFRHMLREQLVDDHERLREIEAGCDDCDPATVAARIDLVWSLARQAGGLF
jgi:hypothetical protein